MVKISEYIKANASILGFILILLLATIALFTLADFSTFLIWDEPVYLGNAKSHIATSHFTEDFRFPLLEYVIAGAWSITGESVFVAKTVMIVFSLLSITGFYLISRELFAQPWLSLLSTLMFSLSPLMLEWGFRIYTDVPSLAMLLFSLFFLVKGFRLDRSIGAKGFMFLSGVFLSLSFLFRFSTVVAFLPFAIFLLYKKRFRSCFHISIGAIVALLPWMISNLIQYGNPLWDLMAQGAAISSYTAFQSPMILVIFFIEQFSFGLILLFAGLISLVWSYRKNRYLVLIASSFLLLLLFYSFIVRLKLSRYLLMFLPFVLLLEMHGLVAIQDFLKRTVSKATLQKIFLAVIVLLLVISHALVIDSSINKLVEDIECENDGALKQSVRYVNETLETGGTVMSNSWPWFGYYGNHHIYSLWMGPHELFAQENGTYELLNRTRPDMIVVTVDFGLPYEYEALKEYEGRFITIEKEFTDDCDRTVVVYDVNDTLIR